jgi:hypothetical protein
MASGILWFKFIPAVFAVGLIAVGVFLIFKRRSVMSPRVRLLIFFFFGVLVASPVLLDNHIRHESQLLQNRAKQFLLRPIPKLLVPNSEGEVGGYFVDTNAGPQNGVFGYSLILIERYATKGRIRWSASIQGQFACTGHGVNPNIRSDAIDTNEEVRIWLDERNAILSKEWQMGFWHWVQDTIEMKRTIPEIEEQDRVSRFIQRINGTWTNASGTMTISPNGTFLAVWSYQTQTNVLKGNQVFRARDNVLMVYPTGPTGTPVGGEKEFRIIHVDDHNLIYEVENQTNSMGR